MLEELIGCAGIPASGSWREDMVVFGPVLVLDSMKFRFVEGQALLDPSRRLRGGD